MSTAIEDPNLANPMTVTVDASRVKERRLKLEPRCKKSSTESPLDNRAKERTLKALPRCKQSRIAREEPKRTAPRMLRLLPRRL